MRRHFKLSKYVFDRTVTNKLELVRFGNAFRIQIGHKSVNRRQKIKLNLDSDLSDVATIFPVDDDMKKNYLRTTAVRQARSRSNRKIRVAAGGGAVLPLPPVRRLAHYGAFLKEVGSTVIPSHWGHKTLPDGTRVPVIVCYYSPRDPNPSCVLGLDSYFTTDSRDRKHPVGWSYNDYREAIANDLRANYIGTTDAIQDSAGRAS